MEIKCPKCHKALELPESARGKKVECPFCRERFVGDLPNDGEVFCARDIEDVFKELLDAVPIEKKEELARLRDRIEGVFKESGIEVLLVDALVGHDNAIMMFNVRSGGSYAKAEKIMRRYCDGFGARSWSCLPGHAGIAVELSFDNHVKPCESIEDFIKRDVWLNASKNDSFLPFPLGVDIANRDIVLDLTEFSVLSLVRSDMPPYDEFIGPRLEALYKSRPDVEFHFVGCGRRDVLPGTDGRELGADAEMPDFDIPSDEGSFVKWCENVMGTLSNIETEISVRQRLLRTLSVDNLADYNKASNERLCPIIVVVDNMPEPKDWENDGDIQHKAWEALEKLMNLAKPESMRLGVHFVVSYTLGDHDSMSDWVGGFLDPYYNRELCAGIVMHWGNYDWGDGTVSARKGFCGPEAIRVKSGHFFVYRSPDNEVYGIHNFAECKG